MKKFFTSAFSTLERLVECFFDIFDTSAIARAGGNYVIYYIIYKLQSLCCSHSDISLLIFFFDYIYYVQFYLLSNVWQQS